MAPQLISLSFQRMYIYIYKRRKMEEQYSVMVLIHVILLICSLTQVLFHSHSSTFPIVDTTLESLFATKLRSANKAIFRFLHSNIDYNYCAARYTFFLFHFIPTY